MLLFQKCQMLLWCHFPFLSHSLITGRGEIAKINHFLSGNQATGKCCFASHRNNLTKIAHIPWFLPMVRWYNFKLSGCNSISWLWLVKVNDLFRLSLTQPFHGQASVLECGRIGQLGGCSGQLNLSHTPALWACSHFPDCRLVFAICNATQLVYPSDASLSRVFPTCSHN